MFIYFKQYGFEFIHSARQHFQFDIVRFVPRLKIASDYVSDIFSQDTNCAQIFEERKKQNEQTIDVDFFFFVFISWFVPLFLFCFIFCARMLIWMTLFWYSMRTLWCLFVVCRWRVFLLFFFLVVIWQKHIWFVAIYHVVFHIKMRSKQRILLILHVLLIWMCRECVQSVASRSRFVSN